MKPLILWHRADFDGVCSAAIAKKFVPDAELHGLDYGDPFPWQKVEPLEANGMRSLRRVFLLDFSLPPEDMKKLAACCDLVWIDHHKSAIEACEPLLVPSSGKPPLHGSCDSRYAACELSWAWFVSRAVCRSDESTLDDVIRSMGSPRNLPEAVRLLGRYDVWDAENPDWARVEAFQFGLRSVEGAMDPTDPTWTSLLDPDPIENPMEIDVQDVEIRGLAILSYRDQEAKALCADGCREETIYTQDFVPVRADGGAIHPHRLVCLNTLQRGSWLFKSVWDPAKHDMMCAYGRLKDGRWRVSLYSTKPEVDCGAIAKLLGGGGHRGAAGFICEKLPWETE